MLSASRRQPHLVHVSAVDRRQTWSMVKSWWCVTLSGFLHSHIVLCRWNPISCGTHYSGPGLSENDSASINVHDVLPVTTPQGKQMMPPADRIYDPGQGAKKDHTDTGDDFLAIGPALRIMQLNVEGLSAETVTKFNYEQIWRIGGVGWGGEKNARKYSRRKASTEIWADRQTNRQTDRQTTWADHCRTESLQQLRRY